jgi:nitrilase
MSGFRLAAVQAAPVFMDPAASTDKACELIATAAAGGAHLAAFSETWLPGYPRFVNSPVPVARRREISARYLGASVTVPGPEIEQICEAARAGEIDVVIGVAELDSTTAGTTYCTLVFIGSDGRVLGRHRKLKPTSNERGVWGEGDGTGLVVHQRPYAAISGLNCWEHNMVLPGYALMAQGTQVHVAAFPGYEARPPAISGTRQLLLARAFASQGAAYVVLVGGVLRPGDVADPDIREVISTLPPLTGDSYIIDPAGEVVAGPARGEEILYADADLEKVRAAKVMCDVGGHYSRPDVLRQVVDRTPARRMMEENMKENMMEEKS